MLLAPRHHVVYPLAAGLFHRGLAEKFAGDAVKPITGAAG
jgi:hypothetical protein